MNKEELIGKLQMIYVGEKNAIDDLVVYYDGLQEIIKVVRKENKGLQDAIKNKDYLLKAQGKELKELYTENEQLENQLDFIGEQNKHINKLETIITKAKELKHKWQKIKSNSTLVFENDSLLKFMNELEDVLKGVNKDE